MKERDIVDFTKMKKNEDGEFIDENGNEVGCEICYTHKKAYEKYVDGEEEAVEIYEVVRCPKCNNVLSNYTYIGANVVSEANFSVPDGNIGIYPIFKCNECDQYYALMPEPIEYNANHDIYYTGGRKYIVDSDQQELLENIFETMKPSIEQYIRRVVDEKEKGLNMWNIMTWCKYDVEEALAKWLYEHGLKK